jgi:hypothetical protein
VASARQVRLLTGAGVKQSRSATPHDWDCLCMSTVALGPSRFPTVSGTILYAMRLMRKVPSLIACGVHDSGHDQGLRLLPDLKHDHITPTGHNLFSRRISLIRNLSLQPRNSAADAAPQLTPESVFRSK